MFTILKPLEFEGFFISYHPTPSLSFFHSLPFPKLPPCQKKPYTFEMPSTS